MPRWCQGPEVLADCGETTERRQNFKFPLGKTCFCRTVSLNAQTNATLKQHPPSDTPGKRKVPNKVDSECISTVDVNILGHSWEPLFMWSCQGSGLNILSDKICINVAERLRPGDLLTYCMILPPAWHIAGSQRTCTILKEFLRTLLSSLVAIKKGRSLVSGNFIKRLHF